MQINIALAEQVRQGDVDRFTATMAAPVAARGVLFTLAALNLEWARLSVVSENSIIVAMRLQWWRDIVDGRTPPNGDAAVAMVQMLDAGQADPAVFHQMIDARGQDLDFAGAADLWAYLDTTAGALSEAAAIATGAGDARAAMRAVGAATGLANWFLAAPVFAAQGAPWLPPGSDVPSLSTRGLTDLKLRQDLPAAAFPASLWSIYARPVLRRAAQAPERVLASDLRPAEVQKRAALLWRAVRGRW
ncbi:hypothetical protein BVG79_00838 [Ketogulonicigenium robustum]|uniref:Phytoene synthase n=1 Tax=Ketogulonicigenium robustum TaxID=92947 RepID=A0A1W6NYL3_9RHOB|nr:squalene/phytoene synthase family protein [Ketogulonicigenium robustum]ARO14190.1 hypothetical protein BVG79_00838 [Ketogulonicigenium robustum]